MDEYRHLHDKLAFENQYDHALIGPHDSRVQTYDTRQFPYNTVCHLLRDFGNGRWMGASGVMIAPNVVLTAAHCLYKHRLRRGPIRLLAAPGRSDRDQTPFGKFAACRFYVPLDFIEANGLKRRRYDYGVVMLRPPMPPFRKFMPLKTLNEKQWREQNQRSPITICGYPGDKPVGTQWLHRERIRKLTPKRLFYTVDTCPGHSGSPIWTKISHQFTVVGIHTSGVVDEKGRPYGCRKNTVMAPPGLLNSGVRLNPEVFSNIMQTIEGGSVRMKGFSIS